jgi:Holliday junction resolvase RusA-like endonuclease
VSACALSYFVTGLPVPQGSMRTVGRGIVIHSNGPKLDPWRRLVASTTRLRMQQGDAARIAWPLDEPVSVTLAFYLPKPKSVKRALPSTKPDLDKLTRAVLDALVQAGALREDSRVIEISATKHYATHTDPGVAITVTRESTA